VQKNAERYLTKRQTLLNRKEECSNAIRDLGVLPEEAYSKYTDTRADKVSGRWFLWGIADPSVAREEAPQGQRRSQVFCPRQQKGV
jgi:hypothetical protein